MPIPKEDMEAETNSLTVRVDDRDDLLTIIFNTNHLLRVKDRGENGHLMSPHMAQPDWLTFILDSNSARLAKEDKKEQSPTKPCRIDLQIAVFVKRSKICVRFLPSAGPFPHN